MVRVTSKGSSKSDTTIMLTLYPKSIKGFIYYNLMKNQDDLLWFFRIYIVNVNLICWGVHETNDDIDNFCMHISYSLLILQSEWFISSYRATLNNCFSWQRNNNTRALIKKTAICKWYFCWLQLLFFSHIVFFPLSSFPLYLLSRTSYSIRGFFHLLVHRSVGP